VGTLNGLNRLDEEKGSFVRYFHDEKDPRSIPNNTIRALLCDSRGRLWVGTTGGGFASYDYEADRFDNLTATAEGGKGIPTSSSVQSIVEDANGLIWIGAWGRGVVCYWPTSGETRTYSMPDNRIYVLNAQERGSIRVGTWGGGLQILDLASGKVDSYRTSKAMGTLPNDVVYCILEDASGELWIGTNGGGIARFDRTRKSFAAFVADPNDPGALPSGKIIASLVDRAGRLWVSVYSGGIHRYDETTGNWIHYRHSAGDPSSIGDDTCNSIYEDREGRIWVCTNVGLSLYNPGKDNFTTYHHREGDPNSPSSDIIYAILEDPEGNYWIGTYTTGLDFWSKTTGSYRNYRFSPEDPSSISDNLITSLAFDQDGRLWIGTNNGLNRFDSGSFVRYYYSANDRKGISNNSIQRISIDSKGAMWISTRGGGLNRYLAESNGFTHFMRKDGLPSNVVYNVLEDREGNLWIVTQGGIAEYDRNSGGIKRISLYKELENLAFTSGSCRSGTGDLYFGSMGMLVKFDPRRYEPNGHVPPVYITQIKAANASQLDRPVARSESPLRLDYWENSMELRFAALDFRDPEQNQFAYKLDGFDKTWTYSSTRNFATYTNLPGGHYVFRVRAANNDGLWNETGARLDINIASSPFLSPYAFAVYLTAILLIGYGLAKIRSNRILAEKVRQLTKAEGQLKEASSAWPISSPGPSSAGPRPST
jgi:ligand-binding sensor domain-containing protein